MCSFTFVQSSQLTCYLLFHSDTTFALYWMLISRNCLLFFLLVMETPVWYWMLISRNCLPFCLLVMETPVWPLDVNIQKLTVCVLASDGNTSVVLGVKIQELSVFLLVMETPVWYWMLKSRNCLSVFLLVMETPVWYWMLISRNCLSFFLLVMETPVWPLDVNICLCSC